MIMPTAKHSCNQKQHKSIWKTRAYIIKQINPWVQHSH